MTEPDDRQENQEQDQSEIENSRQKLQEDRDHFHRQLSAKESRKRRARAEKDQTLRRGFAAFGAIGWSIVVPALIGVVIGQWLDHRFDAGVRYTLSFLVGGVIIGAINAWNWVNSRSD